MIPTGYSFNLDGTSIYMTMAAPFVAQASGVHLSFGQQISVLGTNLIGNAVATMAVARWDGSLDLVRSNRVLAGGVPELHDERTDSISGELAALRDDTMAM